VAPTVHGCDALFIPYLEHTRLLPLQVRALKLHFAMPAPFAPRELYVRCCTLPMPGFQHDNGWLATFPKRKSQTLTRAVGACAYCRQQLHWGLHKNINQLSKTMKSSEMTNTVNPWFSIFEIGRHRILNLISLFYHPNVTLPTVRFDVCMDAAYLTVFKHLVSAIRYFLAFP